LRHLIGLSESPLAIAAPSLWGLEILPDSSSADC
jgi:hypothetical protein